MVVQLPPESKTSFSFVSMVCLCVCVLKICISSPLESSHQQNNIIINICRHHHRHHWHQEHRYQRSVTKYVKKCLLTAISIASNGVDCGQCYSPHHFFFVSFFMRLLPWLLLILFCSFDFEIHCLLIRIKFDQKANCFANFTEEWRESERIKAKKEKKVSRSRTQNDNFSIICFTQRQESTETNVKRILKVLWIFVKETEKLFSRWAQNESGCATGHAYKYRVDRGLCNTEGRRKKKWNRKSAEELNFKKSDANLWMRYMRTWNSISINLHWNFRTLLGKSYRCRFRKKRKRKRHTSMYRKYSHHEILSIAHTPNKLISSNQASA